MRQYRGRLDAGATCGRKPDPGRRCERRQVVRAGEERVAADGFEDSWDFGDGWREHGRWGVAVVVLLRPRERPELIARARDRRARTPGVRRRRRAHRTEWHRRSCARYPARQDLQPQVVFLSSRRHGATAWPAE